MSEDRPSFTPHPQIDQHREFLLYHFMEWIGSHLSDCSRVFSGDLAEMMVLTVIGQVFVRHYGHEAARNYDLDERDLTVSAARISEVTSIPRETVRRKLHLLKQRGWIQQVEDGGWKFVLEGDKSIVSHELMPLQLRSLTRLMNLVDAINKETSRK